MRLLRQGCAAGDERLCIFMRCGDLCRADSQFFNFVYGGVQKASRNEMLETIHRAYEARATGDMEGLMTAFHSHGAFELKGEQKHLQVAGLMEGHDNVRAAMAGFVDTFEFVKRDIIATVVEGERA